MSADNDKRAVSVDSHREWVAAGRPAHIDPEVAQLIEDLRRIQEDIELEGMES